MERSGRGVDRLVVLGGVLIAATSWSQTTPGTNYGPLYDNGDFAVREARAHEGRCPSNTQCTFDFTASMPTGYSASDAVITGYWTAWDGSTGHRVSAIHFGVTKISYNSTTGAFVWRVSVEFGSDAPPTPSEMEFNIYATLIVADNSDVKLTRRTSNCSGDTSALCVDSSTFSGVGVSGTPFRQMYMRRIDVRTSSGNAIDVERLAWETHYPTPGGTSAAGTTSCGLIGLNSGGNVESIDCAIDLVAFASATGAATVSVANVVNGGTYNGFTYGGGGVSGPSGSVGGFTALKQLDLTFTGGKSPLFSFSGGCFDTSWTSSPAYLDYQFFHQFTEDNSSPWLAYEPYVSCYEGILP